MDRLAAGYARRQIELGIILVVLMGWQIAAAEFAMAEPTDEHMTQAQS